MQNKTDKRTSLVSKSLPVANFNSVNRSFSARKKKCYVSHCGRSIVSQFHKSQQSLWGSRYTSDWLVLGAVYRCRYNPHILPKFATEHPRGVHLLVSKSFGGVCEAKGGYSSLWWYVCVWVLAHRSSQGPWSNWKQIHRAYAPNASMASPFAQRCKLAQNNATRCGKAFYIL